jgi:hypothetical protein
LRLTRNGLAAQRTQLVLKASVNNINREQAHERGYSTHGLVDSEPRDRNDGVLDADYNIFVVVLRSTEQPKQARQVQGRGDDVLRT